ncbi:hypothetical protein RV15_GL003572 [Enterococcus silesiacus]|nr:hypothetical protein RV15_GL003572 [Enterococcus silesiacus]
MIIDENKEKVLGFNYDFYYHHGLITVNQRQLNKTSIPVEVGLSTATWVSKYGSITFSQFGVELPSAGMNEKGLSIVMLFHEEGQFPDNQNGSISELQWIQFQLDNYATVEEVISNLHLHTPSASFYCLHYSMLDAFGNSAIIEFIEGEASIYFNESPHIISNTSYKASINYALAKEKIEGKTNNDELTSLNRFMMGYQEMMDYSEEDTAIHILQKCSLPEKNQSIWQWIGQEIPQTYTAWTITFRPESKKIIYTTCSDKNEKIIDLNVLDFETIFNRSSLDVNNSFKGDVMNKFHKYDYQENKKIIRKSYQQLTDELTEDFLTELTHYPDNFH